MFAKLMSLFDDKCPVCSGPLLAASDAASSTKSCPHGHYKEESYGPLGTRFVYKDFPTDTGKH
ncbi:hypothetical protein H7C19_01170 [Cohnella nanjingensis]|uniref:Uncharacterized protein n=2 Tax=Cohnella nanjingensis TaxID=1387779 RepID=A0A7X0VCU4_9BACL|nr:hypothetical protein [Cohnella nanjingensis]